MKITYILPAIGKKTGEKYIKTWRLMEPLVISTLKALTPDHIDTEFYDDRIELIDYDTNTDLVVISVEMYTAKRAYEIASQFKKRGVRVIGGGYHPTLMPDEALRYFDCVVLGNSEDFWHELLEDAEKGRLKKIYKGCNGFKSGVYPDRSIYGNKKYSMLGLVETGRGCVFNCEFCTITSTYKQKYYRRLVEDVVEDIKKSGKKYFFFVDDNIVADEDYATQLFKALKPLKIKWSGQGSLTMARNDELLQAMKESGCMVMLIGYESMNVENLIQMGKQWTVSMGERDELTEKIHSYGIGIYATFVFGNEGDSEEVFEESLAFSMKHEFFFVAYNHLLPFPGTKLHHRLISEGRLLEDEWWLKDGYKYGDIPYQPIGWTPEELSEKCADLRRRFFNVKSIIKRSITAFKRQPSLFVFFIFLTQNMNLRKEVDEKLRLPIGCGLDELPK